MSFKVGDRVYVQKLLPDATNRLKKLQGTVVTISEINAFGHYYPDDLDGANYLREEEIIPENIANSKLFKLLNEKT